MNRRMFWVLLALMGLGLSQIAQPIGRSLAATGTSGTLTLSPNNGQPGTEVTANGHVSSTLKYSIGLLIWNGGTTLASFQVDRAGSFSSKFAVPNMKAGQYAVAAQIHGLTIVQSTFTIGNGPGVTPSPTSTPTSTATATALPTATSTPSSTAASNMIPVGVLEPAGSLFGQEAQSGLKLASIELAWDQAEPSNGGFNESYFQSVRNTMASAQAAGLSPVLSLGIQYTPSWVFGLDPASRFIDQYGDVWNRSTASGEGVANFVFSQTLRGAEAAYINRVFSELGTNFAAVRWGGGLPYDEVRYPWCPTGRTNCYWAFDANAQAKSPVPGYVPGQGNPSQAQTFLNFYLGSIQSYITWGMGVIRQSYSGEIDVLFGSWGVRPGDISAALSSNLNGSTTRSDQIAAGMDWQDQIPADSGFGNVVAWSTWLNRQDDFTDVASWSPIHYLASLVPAGMGLGGENTYGKATLSDLQDTMTNARTYHLRRVLWMNESLTQQTGNATIVQIGQAAQ